MNNRIMFFVTIAIIGTVVFFFLSYKKKKHNSGYNAENIGITVASEDKKRLQSLGMDRRSDSVSAVLNESKLSFPRTKRDLEHIEYKADLTQEWAIDVSPPTGEIIIYDKLNKVFDLK